MPESPNNTSLVLTHTDTNGVCTLTLNRPKAYNALSLACMEAVMGALAQIAEDAAVKVVIIAGAGKGFCAGHDLKEMQGHPQRAFYEQTFQTCTRMMLAITRLPKPVIAQVHGIATAAGCQLVATCDLAVAAADARFATPGVNIGLFCSTPMVALSRNVSPKQAMEMLLLGEMITAPRAYEIGLINRIVAPEQLELEVQAMAAKLATKSPMALKTGKRAFYEQLDRDLDSAYAYCSQVMVENTLTDDAQEGIEAFLAKRPPVWRGT